MDKNAFLEPEFQFDVPARSFCESERLIGAMLSISENLKSKGQRPIYLGPNMGKISVGSITSLKFIRWQY